MLSIIPKEILASLINIYKLLDIEQNSNKKDNNNNNIINNINNDNENKNNSIAIVEGKE